MTILVAEVSQDLDGGWIHPRDAYDGFGCIYSWESQLKIGGEKDTNNAEMLYPWKMPYWAFNNFSLTNSPINGLNEYILDYDEWEVINKDTGEKITSSEHIQEFKEKINQWMEQNIKILPIYEYHYSNVKICTVPSDFDSSAHQIGFIYVNREMVKNEGLDWANPDILKLLEQEIKTINQYLTGDIWQYLIYQPSFDNLVLIQDLLQDYTIYPNPKNTKGQTLLVTPKTPKCDFFKLIDSCGEFYGKQNCMEDLLKYVFN